MVSNQGFDIMLKIACAGLVAIGTFALIHHFHVSPQICTYAVCGLSGLFALALMK